MNNNTQHSAPHHSAPDYVGDPSDGSQAENVVIETGTVIKAGAAVAPFVATQGKLLWQQWFDKGVPVQVLASWSEDDQHLLALKFHNPTAHGAYVEKVSITKPTEILVEFVDCMDRRAWDSKPQKLPTLQLLPLYLPPGEAQEVVIRFKIENANTREVKMAYSFTLLPDKSKEESEDLRVA